MDEHDPFSESDSQDEEESEPEIDRQLYSQWNEADEGYAPFGTKRVEGVDLPLKGAPNISQLWPYSPEFIGDDYERPFPEEGGLHPDQLPFCQSALTQNVEFVELLGKGQYGQVWKVIADFRVNDRIPWARFQLACKLIQPRNTQKSDITDALNDMLFLRYLRHENICNLSDIIGIPDRITRFPYSLICLFMEYCQGSFLKIVCEQYNQDRFKAKKSDLPENLSRHWFSQIVRALEYIHRNGVNHGDITPENIGYKYQSEGIETLPYEQRFLKSTFKLIDFGLAESFEPGAINETDVSDLDLVMDVLIWSAIPCIKVSQMEETHSKLKSQFLQFCRTGSDDWSEKFPKEWESIPKDLRALISDYYSSLEEKTDLDVLMHPWLQNNDEPQTEPFIRRGNEGDVQFVATPIQRHWNHTTQQWTYEESNQ